MRFLQRLSDRYVSSSIFDGDYNLRVVILILCGFFILPYSLAEDAAVSSIGYASVSEALRDLTENPAATVENHGDWIVISLEDDGYILWSFTPTTHPAHPSAVKRSLVEADGAFHILMNVLCESTKSACDSLVEDFKELNEKISSEIRNDKSE